MNKEIIGSICLSNFGGIEILNIEHGISEKVKFRYNFGTPGRICTAYCKYDKQGDPYFNSRRNRYYFNDILRT